MMENVIAAVDAEIEEKRLLLMQVVDDLKRACAIKCLIFRRPMPDLDEVLDSAVDWKTNISPPGMGRESDEDFLRREMEDDEEYQAEHRDAVEAYELERQAAIDDFEAQRKRGRGTKRAATDDQIAEVRQLHRKGYTHQQIADRVGLKRGTVGNIINRSTKAYA